MEKYPIKFDCFFDERGIYMAVSLYDNLTNTLEYPHFLKNVKPHESENLNKHIAFCIGLVIESRSRCKACHYN